MSRKERAGFLVLIALHTTLVVVATVSQFVFSAGAPVAAPTASNTALNVVVGLVHGLLTLLPSLIYAQTLREGRTRGTKKAAIVACSLAVLVQASAVAARVYIALAAPNLPPGPWLLTLTALAADLVVLVVLLTWTIALRLDLIRY